MTDDSGCLVIVETRKRLFCLPSITNTTNEVVHGVRLRKTEIDERYHKAKDEFSALENYLERLIRSAETVQILPLKTFHIKEKEDYMCIFYTIAAEPDGDSLVLSVWEKKLLNRRMGNNIKIIHHSEAARERGPLLGRHRMKRGASVLQAVLEPVFGLSVTSGLTAPESCPPSLLPDAPLLIGREAELEKLAQAVRPGTMTALVGVAGVGKSHIAKKFVRDWLDRASKAERFVFWFGASTETSLRIDYLEAMTHLGEGPTEDLTQLDIEELASRVWKDLGKLDSKFEWVLVFDDVPEVLGDLKGPEAFSCLFFSAPLRNFGRGRILLTTRCTAHGESIEGMGNHNVAKIVVDPVDESTAVKMLLDDEDTALVSESEMKAAMELVRTLVYMPLAIVIAKSEMVAESVTASEYLEDLKNELLESDLRMDFHSH